MEEQFNLRKEITLAGDAELEKQLRPLTFSDFKGQQRITDNLSVFVTAAYREGKLLTTCCFMALPGWGRQPLQP